MRLCKKENVLVAYHTWKNFHVGQEVTLKVWTLAGVSVEVFDAVVELFSALPRDEFQEITREFFFTEQRNMHSILWLQNTALNQKISPLGGGVVLSSFKVTRVFGNAASLEPEFELNIYTGDRGFEDVSDIESQESDEMDSQDSGWAFNTVERFRVENEF